MKIHPLQRFFEVLRYEKHDIWSIYFYAVFTGILQLSLPVGIQSIISFVLGGTISTSIVLLIIFVVAGVFVSGLLQVNQMKLIEKIQQQLFVRYSFQYAYSIPKLDLKEVDGYYLPELVNRFFDTVSLQKGISKILLEVPAATLQMLFGLILLSFYHPVFILFGLLLLTVVFLLLRFSGKRGFMTSMEESNYKYMVAGYLQDLARAVFSFKFSRNRSLHIEKTDHYVQKYLESRTAHFRILLFQYWTLIGFKVVITAAMLIVGSLLLVKQQLNIGQFIAAEIVILMVMTSVEKLILNLDKVYDVMTSLEKISKVTDKKQETYGGIEVAASDGISMELKEVTFGYETKTPVLKNVSLDINAGEHVCIMGAHSSGKSTLARFLSGSFRDFEGIFSVNGISLAGYDIKSLRSVTGILLHQQEIFEGTLLENILLHHDLSLLSEVHELAAVVGLQSFVGKQRDGYNMKLNTEGQHLSGRVIKKILLLRALVNKPKLLLLEEPWLGLDDTDAARIRDYLLQRTGDATVIVISNDASFAAQCDKVVFLESGTVRTSGKWEHVKTQITPL